MSELSNNTDPSSPRRSGRRLWLLGLALLLLGAIAGVALLVGGEQDAPAAVQPEARRPSETSPPARMATAKPSATRSPATSTSTPLSRMPTPRATVLGSGGAAPMVLPDFVPVRPATAAEYTLRAEHRGRRHDTKGSLADINKALALDPEYADA